MADSDYSLVLGLDAKHLRQLSLVWPTWQKHKPDMCHDVPLIVFFDREQITASDVRSVIGQHQNAIYFPWPCPGIQYAGQPDSKWYNPQRYKMLSGFVHVPAMHCTTTYWLKVDTDVVAVNQRYWIDEDWFRDEPSIIAHPWRFTKPPEQMDLLDAWVARHPQQLHYLNRFKPLKLHPQPGSERIGHKRIISWCGLFNTAFTKFASRWATDTCGEHQLPVPSQDGYLWYLAKRSDLLIREVSMKQRGWQWWSTEKNIRQSASLSLCEEEEAVSGQ